MNEKLSSCFHRISSGFSRLHLHRKLKWIGASLLAGAILCVVIPLEYSPPGFQQTLTITATGDRDEKAKASEIWITSIDVDGQYFVDTPEITNMSGWEKVDGRFVSKGSQPAKLVWEGSCRSSVVVSFLTHDWSGYALINWNGTQQEVNLFSPSHSRKDIRLLVSSTVNYLSFQYLIFLVTRSLALGLMILLVFYWLVHRGKGCSQVAVPGTKQWWVFAVPPMLVWLVYLLAFWPGCLSHDTIGQWGQTIAGKFTPWHPPFHTATLWLINRIWFSPAAIAIVQIVALSLVAAWGFSTARNLGVPRRLVGGICLLFALSPVNGVMSIFVIKDVANTIALLSLTLLVLEIVCSDGEWLKAPWRWLLLSLVFAACTLYRFNTFPSVVVTGLLLLITYRSLWKKLMLAGASALVFVLIMTQAIFILAEIPTRPVVSLSPLVHQVAAYVANDQGMDPKTADYLATIHPLQNGWNYYTYNCDPTFWHQAIDTAKLDEDPMSLVNAWWNLVRKNPRILMHHIIRSSSLIWRIRELPDAFTGGMPLFQRDENGDVDAVMSAWATTWGLQTHSLIPRFAVHLSRWIDYTRNDGWRNLVWRPALYMYIAIGAVVVLAIRRRNHRYLLVAAPLTLHALAFMPVVLSQEFRWMYCNYVMAFVLLPFAFCSRIE